jgi:NDP-sugar pyrophosphorylase family protein
MQALILAGGKGTRLRPLTVYTPKPVVPVVNRPFLCYQIEILARAGITDITLSLSYQPDKIESALADQIDENVDLRYITEPHPMGTGGAYKFAAGSISETTIVFNGDILTDLDIEKLMRLHRDRNSEATIALAPVADPSRYGLVETEADGSVVRFLEKPKPEELAALSVNTINAGIYILEPSILDIIPENENCSFEYFVFPAILEQGRRFFSYVLENEYWLDIGTPASYLKAHHDFLNGRISGFEIDRSGLSDIATKASIDRNSVIGDGCMIKPGAQIVNSVLGVGVHVEEKAYIENSVIWPHTRIATSAEIRDAIIGKSCHVGRNVTINAGTVLGDKASIPDYSKV